VDGKASVTDAACPHMGANLGVGGVVVGNCIRCPFHSWEFDNVDGTCKKIPYQDTIPSTAKLFTYHTVEKYGFVVIWWNSADKEGEPHYPFITVSDLDSDNFARLYNFPYPSIKMHLQEFAENTVDVQHFDILHGRMTIPWTKILIPFIRIDHTSTFSLGKEKHEIEFGDNACLKIFGYKVPGTKVVAKILFYGPGSITLFQFDASFGRTYLWHTHTPNDLMDQNVMFSVWAEKKVPRFLSWYVTGNWISQWYNDVTIWENKVFLRKPLLVKGDGPVMKLRRWYQQFYNRDSSTEW
jgi:cholesterol 7-dehydrogenase